MAKKKKTKKKKSKTKKSKVPKSEEPKAPKQIVYKKLKVNFWRTRLHDEEIGVLHS